MTRPDPLPDHAAESRRLHALAYRLLGSAAEAEDAVQEGWARLHAAAPGSIVNPGGWLTTVVARVALDMLRARREAPLPDAVAELPDTRADPEAEAALADAVGVALMVVLDRLAPAERLAFVLHDLFGVPFAEVARVLGRSEAAARQLASRGRRRVRTPPAPAPGARRHGELVRAFYAAARGNDLAALVALLDPAAELEIDAGAGGPLRVTGAAAIAGRARLGAARAGAAAVMLVDGRAAIVVAPGGRLRLAMLFEGEEQVRRISIVGDPARLAALPLALAGHVPG
jgi:RNA polymerase sigma factor (sigma-70 family)